jgi:hypothetical protein
VEFPVLAVSAPTYLFIAGSLLVSLIGSLGEAATCISNLEAPLIPTHYDIALNASNPGKNDAIKNSDGSFKNVQSSSYIYPTALMPNYSKYIGSNYSTLPISNSEICAWTQRMEALTGLVFIVIRLFGRPELNHRGELVGSILQALVGQNLQDHR